jgi:hypothetical protein
MAKDRDTLFLDLNHACFSTLREYGSHVVYAELALYSRITMSSHAAHGVLVLVHPSSRSPRNAARPAVCSAPHPEACTGRTLSSTSE